MFAEKAVAKLKEKGIENAEEVIVDSFKALTEAAQETALEATGTEQMIAAVAAPILMGLLPQIEQIADLNKDGVVGN